MTGAEIAAGKIISDLTHAVTSEDRDTKSTTQVLVEIAKDSPQMLQAADAYAARLALKQQVLLRLYAPLARIFGVREEYFDHQFAADLAAKTSNIPEENLRTPPGIIAIPAMQGLAISLDETNLKEMYLNLLSTATDDRRATEAHPSFSEIIRQLSPDEAALLLVVLNLHSLPIVRIKAILIETVTQYVIHLDHLLDWTQSNGTAQEIELGPLFVENWIRLGLVSVEYGPYLTAEDSYTWVEHRPEYLRIAAELEAAGGMRIAHDKGILRRTTFGTKFAAAVSPTSTQNASSDADLQPE